MPDAVTAPDRLTRGGSISAGQSLVSVDGNTSLVLQSDGNLVIYGSGNRVLWSASTQGRGAASLVLQGDGNLVLYTASRAPVWYTGTQGSDADRLVLQTDGNLALYGSAPRWSSQSQGFVLRPEGVLGPGQSLIAQDGSSSLVLQSDGNFVAYYGGSPQWQSGTTGVKGPRVILQSDGNLVLYGGDNRYAWASFGFGATQVVISPSGNIAALAPSGSTAWATWTGPSLLASAWFLDAGASRVSPDGGYSVQMQSDGNLVVYGPEGAARWSSRTYGNPGARTVLLPSGELVIVSAGGRRLWQSLPSGPGAVFAEIQNDGNLVTYTASRNATWAYRLNTGYLNDYPAQTTPPHATVSRYVRNLRGDAADAGLMRGEGCSDAQANPSGNRYMMMLAVGAQTSNVNGAWGVLLTTTSIGITNTALVAAIKSYIDGYASCKLPDTQAVIAVGTNNDSSVSAAREGAGGTVFAQQVINPLAAYAAQALGLSVYGANDIEPGFKGTQDQALAWTSAYLAATTAPYVFFGSADGCAYQTLGATNGSCNNGYTQFGLYQLSYGLAPSRMTPLPQVYFASSMPTQWANISLTGVANGGPRIAFGGPLTEVVACSQAGSCESLDSGAAWNALWARLNSSAGSAVSTLPFVTDLRIDYRP